jgi:tetratricopeptide (TPR) repeat protein
VVSKAYDYDALGHSLHIPSGELFVILLHETVYGVFEDLSRAGKLRFPPALTSQGERKECVQLVSLRLGERPRADDEAMFLFMRSGWRGNKQTVEKFRQVLDKNPNNRDALLYLGMSLYQVQDYREAIRVFERLNRLTEHDGRPSAHDWSHIWIGHMYDLLGERDKALEQYRMALASRDSKSTMMYGQYGIGPVNAKIWAQQRIQTPFTRR